MDLFWIFEYQIRVLAFRSESPSRATGFILRPYQSGGAASLQEPRGGTSGAFRASPHPEGPQTRQ